MEDGFKLNVDTDDNGIVIRCECASVGNFISFANDLYENLLQYTDGDSTQIKFELHGNNNLKDLYFDKMFKDDCESKPLELSDADVDALAAELLSEDDS